MTREEFVKGFYLERQDLMDLYFAPEKTTEVSQLIASLKLNNEQTEILKQILYSVSRDIMYTILLGLDGEASIGRVQEAYKLFDKDGNELTGGDMEGYAWEYFHNKDK
jgi:hypothetical protein